MNDFGDFDGRAWLNCAHQGPLPNVAVEAATRALEDKRSPSRLRNEDFVEVPQRLKAAVGRLVDIPADEVILGNSTTYGLHLLTHGLPLAAGDEVLLVEGDFPATVVPWHAVRGRGVRVRRIRPSGTHLTAADLERELTAATKVVCTSWVFSFTGYTVDLARLGALCRERDVTFVVNASQGLGARPLSVRDLPVDALVSCGHKWLCGPYGTGFCWVRPDLLETLAYEQPYWQHAQRASDLGAGPAYDVPPGLGAARYDVFAAASFLNATAWTASIEYLLSRGLEAVEAHDDALVDRLVAGVDPARYRLLSPAAGPERSTLVLVSHRDPARNDEVYARLREAGVDAAQRGGQVRLSPHLYNTPADIDRALAVLDAS